MSHKHTIWALHGFLGRPEDFQNLPDLTAKAPNIFDSEITSLKGWAHTFNLTLRGSSVLLGYSMGGRLALHCLLDNPRIFEAAILLAPHPGLENSQERSLRLNHDRIWAERFRQEPWPTLIHDWNQQPIFKGSSPQKRLEHDFCRQQLARCLDHFSLGRQEHLTPQINELKLPILWLHAEAEGKNIQGLSLRHPQSKIMPMKGGHRFLFEHSAEVSQVIYRFLLDLQ
jgi:2-succinyl-6-hydroxy-2,4-cyclohexadiene-1-carboxylate synthase